jgi:hypothetical protein
LYVLDVGACEFVLMLLEVGIEVRLGIEELAADVALDQPHGGGLLYHDLVHFLFVHHAHYIFKLITNQLNTTSLHYHQLMATAINKLYYKCIIITQLQ